MAPASLPEGIEGDGLVLRRWTEREASSLHEAVLASLDHLRPWMAWANAEPLTFEDRRAMLDRRDHEWREGGESMMGIWDRGVVVGTASLIPRLGPGGLEIGYWTHVDHVGRGIATRAGRLLTDLAFTVDGIDRVQIQHDAANRASRRVPEKLGYTLVADDAVPGDELSPGESGVDWIWRATRRPDLRRRARPPTGSTGTGAPANRAGG